MKAIIKIKTKHSNNPIFASDVIFLPFQKLWKLIWHNLDIRH